METSFPDEINALCIYEVVLCLKWLEKFYNILGIRRVNSKQLFEFQFHENLNITDSDICTIMNNINKNFWQFEKIAWYKIAINAMQYVPRN